MKINIALPQQNEAVAASGITHDGQLIKRGKKIFAVVYEADGKYRRMARLDTPNGKDLEDIASAFVRGAANQEFIDPNNDTPMKGELALHFVSEVIEALFKKALIRYLSSSTDNPEYLFVTGYSKNIAGFISAVSDSDACIAFSPTQKIVLTITGNKIRTRVPAKQAVEAARVAIAHYAKEGKKLTLDSTKESLTLQNLLKASSGK